ncbi:MAG: hypothetical protein IIC46_07505 [Planctomycetes bacterium]|nr:hypothetical protein [Planctomycetota bacterium]
MRFSTNTLEEFLVIKNLTIGSIIAGLCSASSYAQPSIEQLAPPDSVVIVSVSNVAASLDRLQQTKLWELWETPQVQQLRADFIEQLTERIDEMLEQLGVEKDTLVPPQGALGFALFPITPEDLDAPSSGMLLVADYGENADKTGELIDAAIAEADDNPDIKYEVQEINGLSVYSFDLSGLEFEEQIEPDFAPAMPMPIPMPMGDPSEMLTPPTKFHFVRDGSVFIVCTDLDRLTEAIQDEPGGDEPGLTEREDYQAIMDQLGESDAYAILLMRDMGKMAAANDPMGMGMAGMMQEMLKTIIGDIQGAGLSLRLDSDSALVEETVVVYMPNGKSGLTALLDTETPRGALPAFVGPDTVNYVRLNFEFENLPDLVMQVMQIFAMMMMPDPEMMQEIQNMVTRLCNTLGQEIHVVSTLTRPITAESFSTVLAVKCTQPQEFENFVAEFGPKGGFEPREFLGQRIYSREIPPMMMPGMAMGGAAIEVSIGISGGYALFGPTAGVEQAMRAVGEVKLPSLEQEASYQRAVDALPNEPAVGIGYSNSADMFDATMKKNQLAAKQMIEQIKEFDPEVAAEIEQEQLAMLEQWEAIDADLLSQFIGPSAWYVRATDDGFIMRVYLLAPVGDE